MGATLTLLYRRDKNLFLGRFLNILCLKVIIQATYSKIPLPLAPYSIVYHGHWEYMSYLLGAIHWTKISGNSGTKSNGTVRFWKLISKIVDNHQRLSFFPEIWKFREFLLHLGIIIPFRPLQDLKDSGGRSFHQAYVDLRFFPGGGTPYNDLYGEAPPERAKGYLFQASGM